MDAVDPTPPAPLAPPATPPADPANEGAALGATAWRILTAPVTLLVLGVITGLFLAWSAFVPGDLAPRYLAEGLGFGTAEATLALGAADPASSWTFWLLVLLMALNLLGRTLATRNAHPALATTRSVDSVLPLSSIPAALGTRAPPAAFRRDADGHTLILRRGARHEGAIFITLGLGALAAAFFVTRTRALDARMSIVTGDTSGEFMRTRVFMEGVEIDRALPVRLTCNPPDPQDPTRTFGCLFTSTRTDAAQTASGGEPIVLRPGFSTRIGDYVLTPDHSRHFPLQPGKGMQVVWSPAGQGAPLLVPVADGQSIRTSATDKTPPVAMTAGLAGSLPWLVATPTSVPPSVHLPLLATAPPAPENDRFALAMDETLNIRITTTPARWLALIALLLLAAGVIFWTAIPDVTVTIAPVTTVAGTNRVTVSSLNRSTIPQLWLATLSGALPAPPTPTNTPAPEDPPA